MHAPLPQESMHRLRADRRIRVCHIMSADMWAGAEVQLLTLAGYLAEQPEIDLFVVLFNDGVLARELRTRGIRVAVVEEQSHSAIEIVRFLTRFLKVHDIELIHTHRYKDNLLGILAAKLAGVPHVIRTVHGLIEPARGMALAKVRLFDALDRAALRYFADLVIAVSRHTAETLQNNGVGTQAVRHIHNGVDVRNVKASRNRSDVRSALGAGPDTVLIGTAGRLTAVKAQDDLMRAARRILEQEPRAMFVLVGDGPLAGDLRALAAELGIADRIVFAGARQDVIELIAAMDIFVLPSLSEGIPMALLEAMVLGTPVVATTVGGIPEIVTHRESGLLVPSRDPHALAEACLELARHPSRARALAARAREVVPAGFSHETNGTQVMSAYRAVTAEPRLPQRTGLGENPGVLDLCSGLVRAFVTYSRRRCRRALAIRRERRRMSRLRNDPAPLTSALRSARRILIVCHGNIIRSPFAARLVAQALQDRGRLSIVSAGLAAVPGRPPHPTAVQIATARSVDLSDHAASPLASEIVASSDVIFVMDVAQVVAMIERFPEARERTFLLTSLASDAPLEIGDPVDGDEAVFSSCFDHISQAVRPIVHTLCNAAGIR